jgi:hypothetical protein
MVSGFSEDEMRPLLAAFRSRLSQLDGPKAETLRSTLGSVLATMRE